MAKAGSQTVDAVPAPAAAAVTPTAPVATDAVEAVKLAKPVPVVPPPKPPPPPPPPEVPDRPASHDRFKVLEHKTLSFRGQVITLHPGTIISDSSYGPGGAAKILQSGVKVEKLSSTK